MNDLISASESKKPNFPLIVALSAVFILIFFVVAYVFLHKDAKKVDPHGPSKEPNSTLILPRQATVPVRVA